MIGSTLEISLTVLRQAPLRAINMVLPINVWAEYLQRYGLSDPRGEVDFHLNRTTTYFFYSVLPHGCRKLFSPRHYAQLHAKNMAGMDHIIFY